MSLADVASLHNLVTVVDSAAIFEQLNSIDTLADRGWQAGYGDARTVSQLLCDQLEFADVLIVNKVMLALSLAPSPRPRLSNSPGLDFTRPHTRPHTQADLLEESQIAAVERLLRKVNPGAEVLRTSHSCIEPKLLLDKARSPRKAIPSPLASAIPSPTQLAIGASPSPHLRPHAGAL